MRKIEDYLEAGDGEIGVLPNPSSPVTAPTADVAKRETKVWQIVAVVLVFVAVAVAALLTLA